jgi:hypothetical protein
MPTDSDQLLEGLLRGDSSSLRELLVRLRPHCLQVLWERFARLGAAEAEILDEAESLLFEWSLGPGARERLLRDEPLSKLAFRLVWEVARQKLREGEHHERLTGEVRASGAEISVDPPAPGFGTEAIVAVLLALPATHGEVLAAEARHQQGLGPPIAEALTVEPVAARVRLTRARAALARALYERGLGELINEETSDA